VVHGVSFSVGPGRTLAIVGGSGSGKTASVLGPLGLLPAGATVTGSARVAGIELVGADGRDRRRALGRQIGVVFQDPYAALNPLRTVGAQVGQAVRSAFPAVSRAEVRRRTIEVLDEVGLPEPARMASRHPHELSGGMRQRVLIAAAVAGRPGVLIADEPTSALDVTVQAEILAMLRRLVEETAMAMILVSHDLAVVAELADEIAVMHGGRIVEHGPAAALLAAPTAAATRELLAAAPRVPPPPRAAPELTCVREPAGAR
jgi:ABC-type glutathione transport system ATPase component